MSEKTSILVADDEENILISLEFLFKRAGFTVHVAQNGKEALSLAREHQPALIMLDVMMPELDGFSVCQALRGEERFANTPIIMLTAKGRDADKVKGKALGATDYVVKPFSTRELLARVRELIDNAAQ